MKLKVCGMKYAENIRQIADLQPDYLGFIFYKKSPRNFEGIIPELPKSIKKVGVFVNESIEFVKFQVAENQLDVVQLHGEEAPGYIQMLKNDFPCLEIIKVFGINDTFDFDKLKVYEEEVDYFLFDTKGKARGGNGICFDWKILNAYPLSKPYFLSGGIGLNNVEELLTFLDSSASKYCVAVDVNSRFEVSAGLKSKEKVNEFISLTGLKKR